MATIKECSMKISWVLSDHVELDPTVDINKLKDIGAFWGSWRTWRAYQTDNVLCNDLDKADELLKRAFHAVCNLYIPSTHYATLNRPTGVKLYEGEFLHDVEHREEIVALHLAASVTDIVLLLGFDFSEQAKLEDRLLEHRAHNYRGLVRQTIVDNPHVQWVVIDHPADFRKDLLELNNQTEDSLSNVLDMFEN
jgi:hypothetical protein